MNAPRNESEHYLRFELRNNTNIARFDIGIHNSAALRCGFLCENAVDVVCCADIAITSVYVDYVDVACCYDE